MLTKEQRELAINRLERLADVDVPDGYVVTFDFSDPDSVLETTSFPIGFKDSYRWHVVGYFDPIPEPVFKAVDPTALVENLRFIMDQVDYVKRLIEEHLVVEHDSGAPHTDLSAYFDMSDQRILVPAGDYVATSD